MKLSLQGMVNVCSVQRGVSPALQGSTCKLSNFRVLLGSGDAEVELVFFRAAGGLSNIICDWSSMRLSEAVWWERESTPYSCRSLLLSRSKPYKVVWEGAP